MTNFKLSASGQPTYAVNYKAKSVVVTSDLGIKLKDKPAFNPTAKTAQDVNRDYFFKGDPANPDVKVFWKKTATSGYEPHLLYSGNYQVGGGKLTLSGSSGQKEIIDLATGKIDSTNVAILPSSTDPNAYAQDINLAKANLSRNTTGFNSWYFNMKMFNYKNENPTFFVFHDHTSKYH